MSLGTSSVSVRAQLTELANRGWFITDISEEPDGLLKVSLRTFEGYYRPLSITLPARSALDISEFLAYVLNHGALRDRRADDHFSRAVITRVAPIGGPSLLAVTDDEAAATGPAPKDPEPGEEAV